MFPSRMCFCHQFSFSWKWSPTFPRQQRPFLLTLRGISCGVQCARFSLYSFGKWLYCEVGDFCGGLSRPLNDSDSADLERMAMGNNFTPQNALSNQFCPWSFFSFFVGPPGTREELGLQNYTQSLHFFARTCLLQKPDENAFAGQSTVVIWPCRVSIRNNWTSKPVKAATFPLQSIKADGWIRWGYV